MASLPILLLLVAGALSAPYTKDIEDEIVAEKPDCDEALTRFRGTSTSVYDYLGETENAVVGTSKDTTGMKVTATVYIQPVKRCMFSMQIIQAELYLKSKNSPDFSKAAESEKFGQELEAQDLLFNVKGGEMISILPTEKEQPHVLNIKRGILSAMQLGNPATQERETDVNGNCAVKFERDEDMIIKSKNLTKCTQRARTELGIQSASIEQSDLPITPLDSSSSCSYKLDSDGKLESAECKESHLFRPFSAGYESPSGAMTTVYQSLVRLEELEEGKVKQLTDEEFGELQEESLIYGFEREEVKPVNTIVDRIDRIMNALVDQADKSNLAVKQNDAHEFSQLVALLRKLDRKRMTPIWDKYFDCAKSRVCQPDDADLREVYKQYLLDALTYCGTPTCVYMVHNVIISEVVAGERMNMFLQGIALVAQPTKGMIRDIMNIASRVPSRQAYLTLGTLLYRYCNANPEGCAYEKTNPVTQAELFLEDKLGESCEGQENADRVEELIRTFKAIGNSGRPSHAWATLAQCARKSIHQNVSIAALEAMRRMPCTEDRLERLHDMLTDINTDPERRIHVFLAIMKCPSKKSLTKVVNQLEQEPSRQVASFIWSHLKSINESSDPVHDECKKSLKEILQGKTLKTPELDFTKYSRAWEASLHSGFLKSGVSTGAHVIFHPESYLPRSGLLNFTATVLGVPLNVLEMAIRVEGLETIVEDVFGPNGVMPDNSIMKLFNITITKEDFEKAERSRNRRDVDNTVYEDNISKLHSRVNKRRIQPSGHLSVKMFGHDMKLFSYDDIFWMIDQIDNMNVIELLLNLAKGGQKTFTKSFMFLEMTQTVPTGLGLPLKLKLTGTAVASLELSGKFDIRNMFWGPSQMELRGFARPSAVAEISGQMGIESHFINSGLLVRSSVFTSQMLKGGITYKEGQILKINIDAPEEPMTLFNVSTTPYLFLNEEIEVIQGAQRRISPNFCLNDTIFSGLGLCTSFAVPVAFRDYESPYFPLSGPAHYGMQLIKADKLLTTYELQVKKEKVEYVAYEKKEYIGTFELGTPGATYSRRVAGMVKYIETPKTKAITIGSFEGQKKVEFYISYHNDTNRFEADFATNLFTPEEVSAKFLFFNDTTKVNRHIGVLLRGRYGSLYKVEQMLKLVNSPTSYKLFSRTTYYPKKHFTGEIEFIPAEKSVNVRFDANQFNQTIDLMGQIINTPSKKGLNFTALHLGSKLNGAIFAGYVRDEVSRRLVLSGNVEEKNAEVSVGLFNSEDGYELKMQAEALDKKFEIFSNYSSYTTEDKVSEVLFGGRYAGRVAGGRLYYQRSVDGVNKDFCGSIFLDSEEPSSLCLSLDNNAADELGSYKRASVVGRLLKRKLAVEFEYEKNSDQWVFNTTVLYNDRPLAQNTWMLTYDGIWDTELKMLTKIKQREAIMRWYSTSKDTGVILGMEGKLLGNVVALTATYTTEEKEGSTLYGVLFQATVNKKLPIDYHLLVEWSPTTKGVTSNLRLFKYEMKTTTMWVIPAENEYSLTLRTALKKEDFVLFGFEDTGLLIWKDDVKSYKEALKFTVWNKSYLWSFKLQYRQGLDASQETIHELSNTIVYGQGKQIKFVTTLLNGKNVFEVFLTTHFLNNRKVVHSFVYNKVQRLLNVDIEFLPRMFIRFLARLDKEEGWKLTTNLKFDWEKMNRALEWVTKYTDSSEQKGLTFRWNILGKEVTLEGMFQRSTKTLTLAATAFRRTIKIVGGVDETGKVYFARLITVVGDAPRIWIESLTSLTEEEISYELRTPAKSLVKAAAAYKKAEGIIVIDLIALGKQIVKFDGQYVSETKTVTFEVSALEKQRLRITGKLNPDENTVFLHFDAMKPNRNIGFAGKYDPTKMSVTLSVELLQKIFGLVIRGDYKKYIIGADVFYQDRIIGWHAYADPTKKALVYNITLTPRLSGQTILEIVDDRIVKFTVQRKIGEKIVNETTFKYDLQENESNLIFQWNNETIATIRAAVAPILKQGYENITILAADAYDLVKTYGELGTRLSVESLRKFVAALLKGTNALDKSFDDYDFVAARDAVGKLVLKAGKQTSRLTRKVLLIIRDYSLILHDNIPLYLENILAAKDKTTDMAALFAKVAKNITDSAKPVFYTAIDLAKEFKLREKSLEEIVQLVVKYIKDTAIELVERTKLEAKTRLPIVVKYIKEAKIPLRDENIGEVYQQLYEQLRDATFEFDTMKTIEWIRAEITKMKILEKTIEEYISIVETEIKKLPELVKSAILKSVDISKEYIDEVELVIKETQEFLVPLTKLVKNVIKSIRKHFSPSANKVLNQLQEVIKEVYAPLRKAADKYIVAVTDFSGPLGKPVKIAIQAIASQLRDVRVLERNIGKVIDTLLEKITSLIKAQVVLVSEVTAKISNRTKVALNDIAKLSTEEIIDKVYEQLASLLTTVTEKTKTLYGRRVQMMKETIEKLKKLYKDTGVLYKRGMELTMTDFDQMVDSGLTTVADTMATIANEIANLAAQLADLDVATPLERAWVEADVLNHLDRYGVNGKIVELIQNIKSGNLTEIIVRAVERILENIVKVYTKTVAAVQVYKDAAEEVIAYISSIPKKDFEVFYAEVESFLQDYVTKIWGFITKRYQMNYERATKLFYTAKDSYEGYYNEYITPAKYWYDIIKEKAQFVYEDNKDEALSVYNHYKAITVARIEAEVEIIKQKILSNYRMIYNEINNFIKTYEDMTLEEIRNTLYTKGEKVYNDASVKVEKAVKDLKLRTKEIVKKYIQLYKDAIEKAELFREEFEKDILPKIKEYYTLATELVTAKYQEGYKKAEEMYNKAYAVVNNFYNEHKALTIEQMYEKVDALARRAIEEYYQNVYEEVKVFYEKANVLVMETVLPEVKKEMESIFNQTLRASVVLGNKTVECFTPHYNVMKEQMIKAVAYGRMYSVAVYENAKTVLEAKLKTLIRLVLELIKQVRQHPIYSKYEKVIMENKYVKTVMTQYKDTLLKLDGQYQELIRMVKDILKHEMVLNAKEKLNYYASRPEVAKAMKILRNINESALYTIEQLRPLVESWIDEARQVIESLPEAVKEQATYFRQNPEECVWSNYKKLVDIITDVKNVDLKDLYERKRNDLIGLVISVTDLKTKEVAMEGIQKVMELYSQLRTMPAKFQEKYATLIGEYERRLNETIAMVKSAWEESAVRPIVEHEIWSEIIQDVKTHELLVDLSELVRSAADILTGYAKVVKENIMVKKEELKEKIKTEVKTAIATIKKFVKETTLEDIVTFIKDRTDKVKVIIVAQKSKIQELLKIQYARIMEFLNKYIEIAKQQSKIYLEQAQLKLNEYKPKVLEAVDRVEKIVQKYRREVMDWLETVKEKSVEEIKRMYEESGITEKYALIIKMTVREVIDEVMAMPRKVMDQVMEKVNIYKDEAMAKYSEYKAKVEGLAKPYVDTVEKAVFFVTNEIRETAIFVYKYYQLKSRALALQEYVVTKSKGIVPRIPGLVKSYLIKASKSSLKAFHSTMVYIDSIDLEKARDYVGSYVPDVKTYMSRFVVLDPEEMKILIRIPHYMPVTPSFSYQIEKVNGTIRSVANKSMESAKVLIEAMKKRTDELRRDLAESYKVNEQLAKAGLKKVKGHSEEIVATIKEVSTKLLNETNVRSKELYGEVKQWSDEAYLIAKEALLDVYGSENIYEAYEKMKIYSSDVMEYVKDLMTARMMLMKMNAEKMYQTMQTKYDILLTDMKPYYSLIKVAVKDVMEGKDFNTAFKNVRAQLRKTYRYIATLSYKKYLDLIDSIQIQDTELAALVREYRAVHREIFGKYYRRLYRLYKIAKVVVDRTIRIAKTKIGEGSQKPAMEPFKSTAMIFGKLHVMTFDGKVYEMPAYNKKTCTYLLARDFHSGNFSILSQEENIIVITPEMTVNIHRSGDVKSVLKVFKKGFTVDKPVQGLPVQSTTGKCLRDGAFVLCTFTHGVDLSCDIEHNACTIKLSGWHYAKTEGLLGSNNNERFDDLKTPDGIIAESRRQFVDTWEVSGDGECIGEKTENLPACNRAPSTQCKEIFQSKTSPLSRFFSVVNPAPFLSACEIESASCDNVLPMEISHCNTTAAYINILKTKGYNVAYLPQCAVGPNETLEKTWTVSPKKEVDIVVLVSERATAQSKSKTVASVIFSLHSSILSLGYDARYALVGFGGSLVHEPAHLHTPRGSVFVDEYDVTTTIKEMPYSGLPNMSNDAYSAIRLASTLSFRPEALRVFLLINADNHISHIYGPTFDETLYSLTEEADASLFVFDKINFKNIGKGKVFGQTLRKAYLTPEYLAVSTTDSLPAGPFTALVRKTNGGLFSNKLKPSQSKLIVTAMADALSSTLMGKVQTCKECSWTMGNAGEGIPICRGESKVTC